MDQIANMANMIKNASSRGHESVSVPHSKMKEAILECLKKEGFISSFEKKTQKGFPVLESLELQSKFEIPKWYQ